MPTTHYRTCHICEANCGVVIEVEGRKVLSIKGDAANPLSRGHICPKATAIADLQDDPDRLRTPVKRVGEDWVPIGWEQAYAEIADRLAGVKARGGAATLYLGNPLAHNYTISTVMPPLRKALGAKGIFSSSTVDQIPHQLVQMLMYGHNALFPIPDIDRTMLMLIIGGNPLASNGSVWTVPDVKKRIEALQGRGGQLVVIDPRRTETAKIANEHLFVKPGTDSALLIALLLALDEAGLVQPGRLTEMLADWDMAWDALRQFDLETCAAQCGISPDVIRDLAARLGNGQPAIVYGRMGVSVTAFGTLNHWLINLLNISTANLDRVGGAMFTQPAVDIVSSAGSGSQGRFHSRVSGHPELLGEFPAVCLTEEIVTPGDGQIRALVTIASNPVLSAPNGGALDAALAGLELMVSIDMYVTGTTRHAHYILPPCGPLEKDHYPLSLAPIAIRNFANYSPATLPMSEGAKADWEIIAELARAIGARNGEVMPNIRHPREALDAMLRRSPRGLTLAEVEAHPHGMDLGALEPAQLPVRLQTPDKRIACAPPVLVADLDRLASVLADTPIDGLRLIGRRHVRNNNSWLHNSRRLLKGPDRCTLMIHPDDATARGIAAGAIVTVRSRVGAVSVAAEVSDDVMPGVVSLPHGFGHNRAGVRLSVAREKPGVSANDLTDGSLFDPLSGNAVLNGVPVEVELAAQMVAAE